MGPASRATAAPPPARSLLRSRTNADSSHVKTLNAPSWWTWRASARWRLASLASAWALILGSPLLGPLVWPLAVLRFGASSAQTVLNILLGRTAPVGGVDRLDKCLVVAIFAGAYAAAGIARLTGDMTAPWLFLPMLLPFSALQARMVRRSLTAHEAGQLPRGFTPSVAAEAVNPLAA